MTEFNPADPQVLGSPWAPDTLEWAADSAAAAFVQKFRSTVTESLVDVRLSLRVPTSPVGPSLVEIFAAGAEVPTNVATNTYAVNVTANNNLVADEDGTLASIDRVAVIGDGLYWVFNNNDRIDCEFAAAAFSGRLMHLGFDVVVEGQGVLKLSLVNGGIAYWTRSISATPLDSGTVQRVDFGELNPVPASGIYRPWLTTDIAAFDTATWRLRLQWQGSEDGRVDYLMMTPVKCDETRQAFAVGTVGNGTMPLIEPDGTTVWEGKTAGVDYLLVFRRPVNPTPAVTHWLRYFREPGRPAWDPDEWSAGIAVLDVNGGISTVEWNDHSVLRFHAFTGSGRSIDGTFDARRGFSTSTVAVDVTTGNVEVPTIGTEEPSTPTTYDQLQIVTSYEAPPTADLVFELVDGVTAAVLVSETFTLAEWEASTEVLFAPTANDLLNFPLASSARRIVRDLAAPVTVGPANNPIWRFRSTTANGAAWRPPTYFDTITPFDRWGGVALIDLPPVPAGVTAAVIDEALPGDGLHCSVDQLEAVRVEWTATAVGADFVRYELERWDAITDAWWPIAYLADETDEEFTDYEARLGVASAYRIRVVRTDGPGETAGDYGGGVSVTATPQAQGAELLFTTNHDPAAGLAYTPSHPRPSTRAWEFLEADEVQFGTIYGRDMHVAFHPTERRGVRFVRRLVVNAIGQPALPAPRAFGPLRDLAWAPVPYVAVRDGQGNRWFAQLVVPDADERQPGHLFIADITVTETAAAPVPVVIA